MQFTRNFICGCRLISETPSRFFTHPGEIFSWKSCRNQLKNRRLFDRFLLEASIVSFSKPYYTLPELKEDKMSEIDVAAMRKPYHGIQEVFDTKDLSSLDPFYQFSEWFKDACEVPGIKEANAMALATATKEGRPSVRTVLLKGYDKSGFKFFTNYDSRKAKELDETGWAALAFYWTNDAPEHGNTWSRQEENPYASVMFYWEPLVRSVRIEGRIEKLSLEDSDAYFHSRPRSSQIGAIVSPQSKVIESRAVLDQRNKDLVKQYEDESVTIPKPEHWGGYRVIPDVIEFWQGQTNRLHDRLRFRKQQDGEILDEKLSHRAKDEWILERLAP